MNTVFTPSNKRLYFVIDSPFFMDSTQDYSSHSVSSTPSIEGSSNTYATKPTRHSTGRTKRYWSPELKCLAVAKAKIFGLSKATRMLQCESPSVFGELSPSTLQYWVKKENEIKHA